MEKKYRRFDLLPWHAMRAVAYIQGKGAEKHGANTWQEVPLEQHLSACLSHIAHWGAGETIDGDTGESHLWNALTRLSYVVEQEHMQSTIAQKLQRIASDTVEQSPQGGTPSEGRNLH